MRRRCMISTAPSAPMTASSALRQSHVVITSDMFRGHDIVRSTVGFAKDNGQFWNGRLCIRIEQLCTVSNDTTHSWLVPEESRTSSKVRIGMLNASQNRMKRAALSLASISRHPARTFGWLATTPTVCPARWPNPQTMFMAIRLNFQSLHHRGLRTTSVTSYGLFVSSGINSVNASQERSGLSEVFRIGARSMLFDGNISQRSRAS